MKLWTTRKKLAHSHFAMEKSHEPLHFFKTFLMEVLNLKIIGNKTSGIFQRGPRFFRHRRVRMVEVSIGACGCQKCFPHMKSRGFSEDHRWWDRETNALYMEIVENISHPQTDGLARPLVTNEGKYFWMVASGWYQLQAGFYLKKW